MAVRAPLIGPGRARRNECACYTLDAIDANQRRAPVIGIGNIEARRELVASLSIVAWASRIADFYESESSDRREKSLRYDFAAGIDDGCTDGCRNICANRSNAFVGNNNRRVLNGSRVSHRVNSRPDNRRGHW